MNAPRAIVGAPRNPRIRTMILFAKMIVGAILVVGIVAGSYFFEANIVSRTTLVERLCLGIVVLGAFNFYLLTARQAFEEWKSQRIAREIRAFYERRPAATVLPNVGLHAVPPCDPDRDGFDYESIAKKAARARGES